ncbi:MAG: ATP-binding protein, partial [Muribaculaceae bacterium]
EKPRNWFDAFFLLDKLISKSRAKRKVIFLDELPWMDTQASNFLPALEHFWNAYASARKDVLLIVCGSATSWIINKIINNHGGLHNRINRKINLRQFSLCECQQFTDKFKLGMEQRQIMECYMIMGGVPFYWSLLQRGLSLPQNIDRLFFAPDGELTNEFNALYRSLFKNPDIYFDVVKALGLKKAGMTRTEIIDACKFSDSGKLSVVLADLEHCGFIRKYNHIGCKAKDALFQLIDAFTLFYFHFILDNNRQDPEYWSKIIGSSTHNTWCGLAFERICFAHIPQIKKALGINGVSTAEYSWTVRRKGDVPGAQIDLLLDRSDETINICEIKYSSGDYVMTDDEEVRILSRRERFLKETGTSKAIHLTLITSRGVARNAHCDIFQSFVSAKDFFEKI